MRCDNIHALVNRIISPWNYPIQLTGIPLAGAIAAGNAVVIKPSELASATAALFAELIPAYLDPELFKVINGGVDVVTEVLKHKFNHIVYTGSGKIAKTVAKAAAEHLTPTTLELGGKSPAIVYPHTNLKIVARRLNWGKLFNNGQTCIAPDYLYVHESICDELVKEIELDLQSQFPDGALKSKEVARIINTRHFQRLKQTLDQSKGRIVIGGETDESERYIAPTIVVDLDKNDILMQDEIFGPILPIITFKHIDEVVEYVNAQDTPLALYIFSNDKTFRDQIIARIPSGSVNENDSLTQAALTALPFGGQGPSGQGRYHGKHSIDAFSHHRSIITFPLWLEPFLNARYRPYPKGFNLFSYLLGQSPPFNKTPGSANRSRFRLLSSAFLQISGLLALLYLGLRQWRS